MKDREHLIRSLEHARLWNVQHKGNIAVAVDEQADGIYASTNTD